MVTSDQPIGLTNTVIVAVSSKDDGTMLDRNQDFHASHALQNREALCEHAGLAYADCVYQLIQYDDTQTYDRLTEVTAADTTAHIQEVAGDGLFTKEPGVGLFLPVADCVATVVYDPVRRYLALLHLGRHASYADLSTCAVAYFVEKGSDPQDLLVWMSPSAGAESYRLDWFDRQNDPLWRDYYTYQDGAYYLDLKGYNRQRCIEAGIPGGNISLSPVDTVTDDHYFSHSAGDTGGRIAVVAMMRHL